MNWLSGTKTIKAASGNYHPSLENNNLVNANHSRQSLNTSSSINVSQDIVRARTAAKLYNANDNNRKFMNRVKYVDLSSKTGTGKGRRNRVRENISLSPLHNASVLSMVPSQEQIHNRNQPCYSKVPSDKRLDSHFSCSVNSVPTNCAMYDVSGIHENHLRQESPRSNYLHDSSKENIIPELENWKMPSTNDYNPKRKSVPYLEELNESPISLQAQPQQAVFIYSSPLTRPKNLTSTFIETWQEKFGSRELYFSSKKSSEDPFFVHHNENVHTTSGIMNVQESRRPLHYEVMSTSQGSSNAGYSCKPRKSIKISLQQVTKNKTSTKLYYLPAFPSPDSSYDFNQQARSTSASSCTDESLETAYQDPFTCLQCGSHQIAIQNTLDSFQNDQSETSYPEYQDLIIHGNAEQLNCFPTRISSKRGEKEHNLKLLCRKDHRNVCTIPHPTYNKNFVSNHSYNISKDSDEIGYDVNSSECSTVDDEIPIVLSSTESNDANEKQWTNVSEIANNSKKMLADASCQTRVLEVDAITRQCVQLVNAATQTHIPVNNATELLTVNVSCQTDTIPQCAKIV